MGENPDQPVVLDATVCSNYASSGSVADLVSILDRPITVTAVRRELERGREAGYDFLDGVLDRIGEDIAEVDTEAEPPAAIRDRLDSGEAAALSTAYGHGGTLATDDLAARRLATERDVPVTGSIGLLVVGVNRGVIEPDTANEWLGTWRKRRGYYAPVDQIEDVLD